MSRATRVPSRRAGEVRFGRGGHTDKWDPSVKTTQLTPEQLERLRAGEKLDDILKEEAVGVGDVIREKEVKAKPKVISYAKYEELEIENQRLKEQLANSSSDDKEEKEFEEYKKALELKVQEIDTLKANVERLTTTLKDTHSALDDALAAHENASKEVVILKKENASLRASNDEFTQRCETYHEEYYRFEKELKALRQYALAKLEKENA